VWDKCGGWDLSCEWWGNVSYFDLQAAKSDKLPWEQVLPNDFAARFFSLSSIY